MNIIDPKLSTMSKFSKLEFIENTVKFKFGVNYLESLGLDPNSEKVPLIESYSLHANNAKPNTLIPDIHEIPVYFIEFLPKYIRDCFVDFYYEFNEVLSRSDDENGNRVYVKNISKQILHLTNEVKLSKSLTTEYKKVILKEFKKCKKAFDKKFKLIEMQNGNGRDSVPPSFKFLQMARREGELKRFKARLVEEGLIDSDTSDKQFIALFSGKDILSKVNWKGRKNELHYFIKVISGHKDFDDLKDFKWEVTMKCFSFIDPKTEKEFDWKKLKGTHNPIARKQLVINQCFNVF